MHVLLHTRVYIYIIARGYAGKRMEKAKTHNMSRGGVGGSAVAGCTAEHKTKQGVAAGSATASIEIEAAASAELEATATPPPAAQFRTAAATGAPIAAAAQDPVTVTNPSAEARAFSVAEENLALPAARETTAAPAARVVGRQPEATASSGATAARGGAQKVAQVVTASSGSHVSLNAETKLAAADVASPAIVNTCKAIKRIAAGERRNVSTCGGLAPDEVLRGRHIDLVTASAPRPVVHFNDATLYHSTRSDRFASPVRPEAAADALLSSTTEEGKRDFEEASAPAEAGTPVAESARTTRVSKGAAEGQLAPPGGEQEGGGERLATAAEIIRGEVTPEQATTAEAKRLSDTSVQSAALTRQVSKGYTGETWYDFDLPLGRTDPITIIHFNDVYNINSRPDGYGGVARFVTAMQQYQHLHPFILFSGDVFNPSVMSTYTRGRHMVPFLNILKVHTACFGNHDFDFGVDELEYAIGSCNFPWLLSNVFQKTEAEAELHTQWQLQRKKCRACLHGVTPDDTDVKGEKEEEKEEHEEERRKPVIKEGEHTASSEDRDEEEITAPVRRDSYCISRLSTLRTMDESYSSELLKSCPRPSPSTGADPSGAASGSSSPRLAAHQDDAADQTAATSLPHPVDVPGIDGYGMGIPEEHGLLSHEEEKEEKEEGDEDVMIKEAEKEMQRSSGRFVEDYIEIHGLPLANGMKYRLCEWQGIKVGLIGLVEHEWLDTLGSIDQDDVTYVDFVKAANCLSRVLRQKECELVIALTHMRAPNDEKLAREAEDIDLILGGHDHEYYGLQRIGNVPVVKSGTDFRDFTVLTIYPGSMAKKKEQADTSISSIVETTTYKENKSCDNTTRLISSTPSPSLSVSVPNSSAPPSSSSSTISAAFSALAAPFPPSSVSEAHSADPGAAGRHAEEDDDGQRGSLSGGQQRGTRLLPPLPIGRSPRSRSPSRSTSRSSSRGSERGLINSPRSSPNQSPRSHTSNQMRARAPGLVEAKPRMTQKPPSKQFHGPLLPTEMREGEEEMPFFLGGSLVQWKRVEVKPELYAKNVHVERLVRRYEEQLEGQMQKVLVDVGCDLETRFSLLRTRETNVGSWVCDIIRRECRAEIALLNSGTIRSDCVFHIGQLKYGDLAQMLPMADDMCVIDVPGRVLLQALENSVSLLPRTEGRFLQVAGIRFAFDSRKPPGERVLRSSVRVSTITPGAALKPFPSTSYHTSLLKKRSTSHSSFALGKRETRAAIIPGEGNEGEDQEDPNYAKLDMEKTYSVATKTYIAQVEAELLPPLPTMVRSVLSMAELANGIKRPHSRIVFKRLTSFTSMQQDDLLKDFGCRVTAASRYVLAPQTDGRIRDVAYD